MAELTRGAERRERLGTKLVPFDELLVDGNVVGAEIGKRRANFPGTDTLAMNAMPNVAKWLGTCMLDVVCAEGDRLTHIRLLDAAAGAGYRVNLFVLSAPMSVLDARCEARGSAQNRSWRMSRGTMCTRVGAAAEQAGYRVFYMNSERSVGELAADIRGIVPVMRQLQERHDAEAGA
jgi:hypothetical protein